MTPSKGKILLAMSGGTDSSVAAILLLQKGYQVEGVTLMTYSENADYIKEAAELASEIGFPHHVMDVRSEFDDIVVKYFINEYESGRTPNPCVLCNEHLKWASLCRKADELGINSIATGHYVGIREIEDIRYIVKGVDEAKDQSYFLWRLPQHILKRAVFPLANLRKSEVREIAARNGFISLSQKRESMGICFLEGTNVNSFLQKRQVRCQTNIGEIISTSGETIGKHKGISYFTIGQKKGLDVSDNNSCCVLKIDAAKNQLIVGEPEELFANELNIHNYYFANETIIDARKTYKVRIRGIDRVPYQMAKIDFSDNQMKVFFENPVWALTPGQSIVVYDDNLLLGGGVID